MRKMISDLVNKASLNTNNIPNNIKEIFNKKNACYVLITCTEPAADGKMQVEMTCEGDLTLVAYLIESAQGYIEEEENS